MHGEKQEQHNHPYQKLNNGEMEDLPAISPSEMVQSILDKAQNDENVLDTCPLFSEMETLHQLPNGELEWRETARWVRFEELVEEGKRWSKPHVSTLSLHAVFELRSCLLKGTVLLDLEAYNIGQISHNLADTMVNQGLLPSEVKDKFIEVLLKKHKHLYEINSLSGKGGKIVSKLPLIKNFSDFGKNQPTNKNFYDKNCSSNGFSNNQGGTQTAYATHPESTKGNKYFLKKIPAGAEASNIMVGEVPFLDRPITAFIRLSNSANLGNVTEVPIPTRFMFMILGPVGALSRYQEIGRAVATVLGDEVFNDLAYKAKNREHLLAGLDEFLDSVTVLPPGEWDPAIRIEPPASIPSQESRKKPIFEEEIDEEEEERRHREAAGLTRTGRLFGGMINDLKRKAPWYWSDFKDGISMQSVATFFFIYFACLTPIVTFGGLLGEATGNNIAAMETMVGGMIVGVIYGLFSGQPLTILGPTGPVLVFEAIIYDFCERNDWNYLSFRFWIGMWTALILLVLVAIDASAIVCYITRFTEEAFATLIAIIFIYQAVGKVFKISDTYPMEMEIHKNKTCDCIFDSSNDTSDEMWQNYTIDDCKQLNGTLIGDGCKEYYPDIYLLSILLFFGTFFVSIWLKNFKNSTFFPTWVRSMVSDFAVVIAIASMTLLDMKIGIDTPKLLVPSELKPTLPGRGWTVELFAQNPWWSCLIAVVPGILASILFFMDQQITAVIVNRKEHKLRKGGGYHLDLFILSILTAIVSYMGLPWFVAATVRSINHVNSLRQETEGAAPGEKPQFLGIRENRLTHILIFIFIGLSVFITPILKCIPMPVLFGVFLYMGVAPLNGIQFYERILVMFMPIKYQPDHSFLLRVPLKKVHLFTCIQLACLIALWVIKSFSQTSILFPLMLVVMVGIRKVLDCFFTQRELKILDDALPEFKRKEKQLKDEEEDLKEKEKEALTNGKDNTMSISLSNGNVMRVPLNQINITEEVKRSGVWKDVNNESDVRYINDYHDDDSCKNCNCHNRRRTKSNDSEKEHNSNGKRWLNSDVSRQEEKKKLTPMKEEEEESFLKNI